MINKCIGSDIELRNLKWENPLESTVELREEDFDRIRRTAGYSYQMSILEDGGIVPFFRNIRANLVTAAGAFLLGALIFYQSLFVAEIQVNGYGKLTETEIRETLRSAGLYEGVRIEENYSHVKAALYENHPEITWVSVFADGRLIKVSIAEAGEMEEAPPADDTPVDIVAERSGVIEQIQPLQGNALVEAGDYVNAGEVLISGSYEYQSSDYSKGDAVFTMYSHARGQALAKVPSVLTYYMEKTERIRQPTGRSVCGLYVRFGGVELDVAGGLCRYEVSEREETTLLDAVKPLPVTICLVRINEVKLVEKQRSRDEMDAVMAAVLRQYEKDTLQDGESIAGSSISYREGVNVIAAEAFLEVLEDIGAEKEIKVEDDEKNML